MIRFFKTPHLIKKFFFRRLWGFSISKKSIYLTFDDGPDPLITPWILDLLKEKNIQATFFCVGANAEKNSDIVQRIMAEGHAIGNHSMRHEKGVKTDNNIYLESVREAQGHISSSLFRPPYGRLKISQTWKLKKEYEIIMWSWLSYDFDHSIPLETILSKAQKQIKAGDILVLHDNPKCTDRVKVLLPQLIDIILDKKLVFRVIKQKA